MPFPPRPRQPLNATTENAKYHEIAQHATKYPNTPQECHQLPCSTRAIESSHQVLSNIGFEKKPTRSRSYSFACLLVCVCSFVCVFVLLLKIVYVSVQNTLRTPLNDPERHKNAPIPGKTRSAKRTRRSWRASGTTSEALSRRCTTCQLARTTMMSTSTAWSCERRVVAWISPLETSRGRKRRFQQPSWPPRDLWTMIQNFVRDSYNGSSRTVPGATRS